jgi:GAF domain-containing protein
MSGTDTNAVALGLDVSQTADRASEATPQPGDTTSATDDRAGDTGSRAPQRRRDAQIQERREQRRRRATELAQRVTSGLFPRSRLDDNLLGALAARITRTTDADGCDVVRFRIGQPSVLYRAWCGSTVLPRTRLRVARAPRDAPGVEMRLLPASTAFPQVRRPAGATTCVHVLIRDQRTGGAETLGVLTAYRTTPQSFSAEDVAMLDVIADLLGAEFARAGADDMTRTPRGPGAPASAGA